MRFFVLIFLVFGFLLNNSFLQAQEAKLSLHGKINDLSTQKNLDSVLVILSNPSDSIIYSCLTDTSGKYTFNSVPMGKVYKISFFKINYISKFAILETDGVDPKDNGLFPVAINSSLFKEDENDFTFLKYTPSAIAKYNKKIDNIEWDINYIKMIQNRIKEIKNKQ